MAEVELGDILRLGAVMELSSAFEVANVYHVVVSSGDDRSLAAASLDIQEYMDEIYANIAAIMTDEIAPDFLTMQNVTQSLTFGAFAWGNFAGGSSAEQMTAPGVCVFTWARTLKPRVQIRKYYGIFTESVMTDGAWIASVRNACSNALVDHVNEFVGSNGMGITGVAYNRTLLTSTVGLSVASSEEPAYQRRRKRGRGS